MKKLSYDVLSVNQLYSLFKNNETEIDFEQKEKIKKTLIRTMEEILTPNQRQVIIYYYFNQLNIVEIAKILNKNKSTICRTKQAALKKISRHLKCVF